jgi:tRNA-(ms[2]io[6]A)-hydroxylase
MAVTLQPIHDLLACATPAAWLEAALDNQDILLIDHANCEKKAASTALNLMFRYVEHPDLLRKLSRLAREELRHFEQVLGFMERRGVAYVHLTASRYAEGLRRHMQRQEPGKLIDLLIVGAIIEARSCERFAALAPLLDQDLGDFYRSLLRSEARHFSDYLTLAENFAPLSIKTRVTYFTEIEANLILSPDPCFRFHSGPPEA